MTQFLESPLMSRIYRNYQNQRHHLSPVTELGEVQLAQNVHDQIAFSGCLSVFLSGASEPYSRSVGNTFLIAAFSCASSIRHMVPSASLALLIYAMAVNVSVWPYP
jgi:hypothetical protein